MALDLSKLNFFNKLDARQRVLVLFGVLLGIILIVYLGTKYLAGGTGTTGPSSVAGAPQGLQSIPGGQQSQEFSKAVEQANLQRAEQAKMSGSSAIPTLLNTGQPSMGGSPCVICSDQSANVKSLLDSWVTQGNISPDTAKFLSDLADKNVSVEDYAAALDELVKAGKLTPEQARLLLEQYTKQHANKRAAAGAAAMDSLIKSGAVPLDTANKLLDLQKQGVSTADYANALQDLVKQGKITAATAQQLLAQYSQARAKEIIEKSIASLHQMAKQGQITPEVLAQLEDLETRMVPLEVYSSTLRKLVTDGKITPAVADAILKEYIAQKAAIGGGNALAKMLEDAEQAAFAEISELLQQGKISQDTASILRDMINRNISLNDFISAVNQLVKQNKLTPEIAKLKIADYQAIKALRDMNDRLSALQANNASADEYANELKRDVQAGIITPDQASQLMQQYLASLAKAPTKPLQPVTGQGSAEFAKLQQRLQQAQATAPVTAVGPEQFTTAQAQTQKNAAQEQQQRIQSLVSEMQNQASSLVAAWAPPTMLEKVGSPETKKTTTTTTTTTTGAGNAAGSTDSSSSGGAPVIKAGTILFATLDTAVNSDYPDSPVLATIVSGPFTGAKLLGKLTTTKSVAGQMDRVSLNFSLMNMDAWPKSKGVTAYAIDPDTAKTVLASDVNYHYLQRFGAIFATSFVQGYAQAISQSASTTTTGIFGTSTTHPELSPSQKLATAIGQVGTALGNVTQNYVNIPPTVKVDSGVGLGILFMTDVT